MIRRCFLLALLTAAACLYRGVLASLAEVRKDERISRSSLRRVTAEANRLLISQIASETPVLRASAWMAWRHGRSAVISDLIRVADRAKHQYDGHSDAREIAIQALARFRSARAAPVFMRSVDWSLPRAVLEPSPFASYPCARALKARGRNAPMDIALFLATPREERPSDDAIVLFAHLLLGHYDRGRGRIGESKRLALAIFGADGIAYKEDFRRLAVQLDLVTEKWTP